MPKPVVITKEMIDEAAFSMVRKSGLDVLTARNIAGILHCSTQPIYKTYENMAELKESTLTLLADFMMQSIIQYRKTGCAFLDSGLGYINLARTEKVLFRLLFIESKKHTVLNSTFANKTIRELMEQELTDYPLQKKGLDRVFRQTMIFTYGLAVLELLDHLELDEDEIAELLQKTFDSFVSQELEVGSLI